MSDGSFTINRNSEHRRQGELTVEILPTVPPQTVNINGQPVPYLPTAPSSPLSPFGSEVAVAISVIAPDLGQVGNGQNGWVPLGIYTIGTSVVSDTNIDLTTQLELYDRSWSLAQWSLLQNYNVPAAGGSLQAEVVALLTYVWNNNGPGAQGQPVPSWLANPNFQGSSSWTCPPGTYNQGQDPWQACLDMAQSAGQELFFDINGILTAKPIPGSPAGGTLNSLPVVWGFNPAEVSAVGTVAHGLSGTPFTTPAGMTLTMTRDGIYNDFFVSATGANNITGSSTPVMAEAADTNSASPTWIGGPMGDVPYFVYDNQITTQAQGLSEAQYDLAVSIASAFQISVLTPPNPLFDIDDVCTATNPRLGLNLQKFIVDTITTTIRYDAQTAVAGRIIAVGA